MVVVSLVAASCSSGGAVSPTTRRGPSAATASVAVFVPSYLVTQDGLAYDAGLILGARIVRALEPGVAAVELVEAPTEAAAMDRARRAGAELLCVASIEEWKDRDSTWAARLPDRLTLEIALRDVATGDLLRSASYKAQGRQQYLSGNPPLEEMLGDKFERLVRGLLRY